MRSWSPKVVQGEFQVAGWAKYKERGAQQSYCNKWGSQMCRICEQVLGWVRRTHPTRPPRDSAQPKEQERSCGATPGPSGPSLASRRGGRGARSPQVK